MEPSSQKNPLTPTAAKRALAEVIQEEDCDMFVTPPLKKINCGNQSSGQKPRWISRFAMKYDKTTPIASANSAPKKLPAVKKLNTPWNTPKSATPNFEMPRDKAIQSVASKYVLVSSGASTSAAGMNKEIRKNKYDQLKARKLINDFEQEKIDDANESITPVATSDNIETGKEEGEHSEDEDEFGNNYNLDTSARSKFDWRSVNLLDLHDVRPRHSGEQGLSIFNRQKSFVKAKMLEILEDCKQLPNENKVASQPYQFNSGIRMKQHQLHALEFMKWRETRKPSGGIICDEMGKFNCVCDFFYTKVKF